MFDILSLLSGSTFFETIIFSPFEVPEPSSRLCQETGYMIPESQTNGKKKNQV